MTATDEKRGRFLSNAGVVGVEGSDEECRVLRRQVSDADPAPQGGRDLDAGEVGRDQSHLFPDQRMVRLVDVQLHQCRGVREDAHPRSRLTMSASDAPAPARRRASATWCGSGRRETGAGTTSTPA